MRVVFVTLSILLASLAFATPPPVKVALFRAPGVARDALDAAEALLGSAPGFSLTVVGPDEVRRGALRAQDAVLFTGGRGSVQGRLLQDEGRAEVRRFVGEGGGYVGICAGAYMALQGEAEFHKVAIVAGRHATGDRWRRGVASIDVEDDRGGHRDLHYANGPIIGAERVEGLPAFVPLAWFRDEIWRERHDTRPGEMINTPAIVASQYRRGAIVLFSPNPSLDPEEPELLLRALRFVGQGNRVTPRTTFADVFAP
ncbi:MAG: BPL-N domain-containing protein [Myxococcota bacterium]